MSLQQSVANALAKWPAPASLRRGPNPIRPQKLNGEDVVVVELTQGVVGIVDESDWHNALRFYRWHAHLSRTSMNTAFKRWVMRGTKRGGGQVLAHSMVGVLAGFEPSDVIDHIHHAEVGLMRVDNRRRNLRPASLSDNAASARKSLPGTLRGVTILPSGNFAARIRDENGKRRHIGTFATAELAAQAYDRAAIELNGEFAVLNYPLEEVPF